MDTCDVLIVGGGPAGSSCAWGLRKTGLDVAILDRQTFPRDKICGGWITPQVLAELEIDPADYGRDRVLQPITGFRIGWIGGPAFDTGYDATVSYGIRRREFDDYLLKRSGARLLEGIALTSLRRESDGWLVNGKFGRGWWWERAATFARWPSSRARNRRGKARSWRKKPSSSWTHTSSRHAGFARYAGALFLRRHQRLWLVLSEEQLLEHRAGANGSAPSSEHVAAFVRFLKSTGRISFDVPPALLGHAYLLYGVSERKLADDGVLLIGDSAGLAYKQSGEGIRPAIESGLLAAQAISEAQGNYSRESLSSYERLLSRRFGESGKDWASRVGEYLPSSWMGAVGRRLLGARWFVRDVVIDRWFLHANQPGL